MIKTVDHSRATPGDVVLVHGHRVGDAKRSGEILEVLGEPGHEHYLVRWDDGRESVFYPSSDAVIQSKTPRLKETP